MTLIQTIRQMEGLHLQYLFTAQELAIMAMRQSKAGVVVIAYSQVARKIHASVRTAIRHIQRLIELGILTKHVRKVGGWFAWNTYTFTVPFERNDPHSYYGDKPATASKSSSANLACILPKSSPKEKEKKERELALEDLAQKKKAMEAESDAFSQHWLAVLAKVEHSKERNA